MPDMVAKRYGHCINAIGQHDKCIWVMVTGGFLTECLFKLSKQHNVILHVASMHALISEEMMFICDSIHLHMACSVVLPILTIAMYKPLCVTTYGEDCKHAYVICCSTLGLSTKEGFWVVTDVRVGKDIYSCYAERFNHTILAQVCVMFDCDMLQRS